MRPSGSLVPTLFSSARTPLLSPQAKLITGLTGKEVSVDEMMNIGVNCLKDELDFNKRAACSQPCTDPCGCSAFRCIFQPSLQVCYQPRSLVPEASASGTRVKKS